MAQITAPLSDPDKILKEIFKTNEVKIKTELSDIQIESASKGLTLASVFNASMLKIHYLEFFNLQLSRQRQSRKELIEGIGAKNTKKEELTKEFKLMG